MRLEDQPDAVKTWTQTGDDQREHSEDVGESDVRGGEATEEETADGDCGGVQLGPEVKKEIGTEHGGPPEETEESHPQEGKWVSWFAEIPTFWGGRQIEFGIEYRDGRV